jgi:hypothetical protein
MGFKAKWTGSVRKGLISPDGPCVDETGDDRERRLNVENSTSERVSSAADAAKFRG